MNVPEAPVYKDDGFVFGKYDVRFTGKGFHVQAVAVAIGKQEPSHQHFRFRVGATDAAHIVTTGGYVVYIDHGQKYRIILKPKTVSLYET